MKVGIYGDVHITKNMRTLQSTWEDSVLYSFADMYKKFDENKVDFVVGLGDLLDTPEIKAKHLYLLRSVFAMMNCRDYPTYLLLGNHEIESDESNILEFLSEYENIKPITDWEIIRNDFLFIPYNVYPGGLDPEYIKDSYVFTHHDIYGSDLAGGKSKAFFGLDPDIFKDAKGVFNGHVHLKSKVSDNVLNAGSLVVSQHGELRVGDYPSYYILDKETGKLDTYENKNSMIYLTVRPEEIESVLLKYPNHSRLVLKIEYSGDLSKVDLNILHTSYRKLINDSDISESSKINHTSFDLKNYLTEYIQNDESVKDKDSYIKIGMELLD